MTGPASLLGRGTGDYKYGMVLSSLHTLGVSCCLSRVDGETLVFGASWLASALERSWGSLLYRGSWYTSSPPLCYTILDEHYLPRNTRAENDADVHGRREERGDKAPVSQLEIPIDTRSPIPLPTVRDRCVTINETLLSKCQRLSFLAWTTGDFLTSGLWGAYAFIHIPPLPEYMSRRLRLDGRWTGWTCCLMLTR